MLSHVVKPPTPAATATGSTPGSLASSEQPHRGGLLRLPPDAMMPNSSAAATPAAPAGLSNLGSQSSDWRAHPPPLPHHPHQV